MPKKTARKVEPCVNLCSKSMFYKDPSDPPDEHKKEVERLFGSCDTSIHWCQCTQEGRGPDDQPVDLEACSKRNRSCYKGLRDLT